MDTAAQLPPVPVPPLSVAELCARAAASPAINRVEAALALSGLDQVDCPLIVHFMPGLCVRERHVPAGTFLTSKIHRTENQFLVARGRITSWTEETGAVLMAAPYRGVTYPGTRRVLYAHEATVWYTFHPTSLTDPAALEAELFYPHDHFRKPTLAEYAAMMLQPTGETKP